VKDVTKKSFYLHTLNLKLSYTCYSYSDLYQVNEIIQLKGSVKELNMFHNYETEKTTHKDSDVAENLQLYRVVWFFHPRSSCITHISGRSENNIKCVVHDDLGWKNRTTCYNRLWRAGCS